MTSPIDPRGGARRRVLDAALELFAEHGVSGTSLQMIADRIGVTKAAVYHQFPAKDDIALGLLEGVFSALDGLTTRVESSPTEQRRDLLVDGIVRVMVGQRQVTAALYRDPEMERIVADDRALAAIRRRLDHLLDPSEDRADGARRHQLRLGWAVIGSGFTRAVADPQFCDVPDEELVAELVALAHRILDEPGSLPPTPTPTQSTDEMHVTTEAPRAR